MHCSLYVCTVLLKGYVKFHLVGATEGNRLETTSCKACACLEDLEKNAASSLKV